MSEFPEGFCIEHDGQVYRPLGTRQHVTRTVKTMTVIDWATDCPTCGKAMTVFTPMTFGTPTRRCDQCKAPSRTVRRERRDRRRDLMVSSQGDAPDL